MVAAQKEECFGVEELERPQVQHALSTRSDEMKGSGMQCVRFGRREAQRTWARVL